MATIVQNYGPIYGEVVNGTVQGRPNGSVYVPISNTITCSIAAGSTISRDGQYLKVNNRLYVTAVSQDLASNVRISVYSDAELTTLIGTPRNWNAGLFNSFSQTVTSGVNDDLTPGETYYILVELINNGVAVATSTTVLQVVAT